jgi:hypothetical protein
MKQCVQFYFFGQKKGYNLLVFPIGSFGFFNGFYFIDKIIEPMCLSFTLTLFLFLMVYYVEQKYHY